MEKSSTQNWDWLSAVLLFFLLQVTAGRLVVANWAPFLYFTSILAALGVVLGLALGISHFHRNNIIWLAIDYSVMVLPWQWAAAIQRDIKIDFRDQLHLLASRLSIAFTQFAQRAPVNDSFFFVTFISLTIWIIGIAAGYWLTRRDNIFAALIPSAVVMIMIQVYDNKFAFRSWWLAIYLLLALLLIGRRYFLHSRIEWRQQHIAVSEDASLDIINGLITSTLIVVVIAWIFPTSLSSLQAASDAWKNISSPFRDRLSNAVVSLQSSQNSNSGSPTYGTDLFLGQKHSQDTTPVFTVRVLSASAVINTPYYWRGRTYDFYEDGQWSESPATLLDFQPANQNLNLVNLQNRIQTDLQFTVQASGQDLIYAPSQPVWIDKPGSVSITSAENGQNDLIAWMVDPPLERGDQLQVRAEIANPSVAELESASTNYPAWIESRYLEIPQDIKPALQTLAQEVTYGKNTPYDKAEAITNYLRATIHYVDTVPAPPANEDPTLWVLFDTKEGFCNYYASAEILMLRSIGIPARLAVGYAEGTFNAEPSGALQPNTYLVRERDAHAWPEVYFPNIGWIEFEPTVNQNPIVRPLTSTQLSTQQSNNSSSNPKSNQTNENLLVQQSVWKKMLGNPFFDDVLFIVLLLALIWLILFAFRRSHFLNHVPVYLSNSLERIGVASPAWLNIWMNWNQMTTIERSFASINLSLSWLGNPQAVSATAAERAAALIQLLPNAKESIEAVAAEHQSALFTKRPADLLRARRAGIIIILLTLRYKLLKVWNAISGGDVYLS